MTFRLCTGLVFCACLTLACGASSTTPTGPEGEPGAAPASHAGDRLLNPRLDSGTPVMMGYDTHHPNCFTFPAKDAESEKVTCPEGALTLLNDCRGSRLYLLAEAESKCVCAPVSGEAESLTPCPDVVESTP